MLCPVAQDGAGGCVRVNWTRVVLDALAEDLRPLIDGQLPEETREAIEGAGLLEWLPLEHHLRVCEAIRNQLGAAGLRQHFCLSTLEAGGMPLFRTLAQGFVRLFGMTPGSIVRAAPAAWDIIFKNLGTVKVGEVGEFRASAKVIELDPLLCETDTFPIGVAGGFDACLEFTYHVGEVELDVSKLGDREVGFRIKWQPQASSG